MANLREQSLWEEGVYQIETSDPVMGGENGVSNRPLRQLANRTQWLKTEAARLERLIGTNLSTVNQGLSGKVDKTTQVTAGAGLTGGGALGGNIQIQMGTPGKLNGTTTNWAGSNTHTHEIDKATPTMAGVVKLIDNLTAGGTDAALTAEQGKVIKEMLDTKLEADQLQAATLDAAGIAQLSSATDSADEDKAATPKAVKAAFDRAVEAEGKGIPLGAVLAFPAAITNPPGYLKADGSTFDQATYPDLYAALGGNRLPDLRHDSIGMMAWCPTDTPPDGWLPCDGRTISQSDYPELYAYLGSRYGVAGKLPEAQDRYVRNAGNGLTVGQLQDDEIKRHVHQIVGLDVVGSDAMPDRMPHVFESGADIDSSLIGVNAVYDSHSADNGWLLPKLTSNYATGGDETRPKTIVFRLCIKARSGRGDVSYWVRAYGVVANPGSLDASALAAGLQNKSDKGHIHTASDITDFSQAIQAAVGGMFAGQLAETGYLKLPGGLIIQWGKTPSVFDWGEAQIHFPVAFPSGVLNIQLTEKEMNTINAAANHLAALNVTNQGFKFKMNSMQSVYTSAYWLAIGH
ncbi:phage tail protein [Neisseria shayeganii]|uniref:Phage tail collar domain-containing protein n=1 Tax=Neisseria shayeganii 871 TaxID=1032488 RepID=G4CJE5_9NEIS|nr:phage tail protein [Neisseria shayeganii]EGY51996.1 hypothetical protein HMPREF9371_1735 [Neisseria shayeganii 871]